jgi:hypothetical protein
VWPVGARRGRRLFTAHDLSDPPPLRCAGRAQGLRYGRVGSGTTPANAYERAAAAEPAPPTVCLRHNDVRDAPTGVALPREAVVRSALAYAPNEPVGSLPLTPADGPILGPGRFRLPGPEALERHLAWYLTAVGATLATKRLAPWQEGRAGGSTSTSCWRSAAHPRVTSVGASRGAGATEGRPSASVDAVVPLMSRGRLAQPADADPGPRGGLEPRPASRRWQTSLPSRNGPAACWIGHSPPACADPIFGDLARAVSRLEYVELRLSTLVGSFRPTSSRRGPRSRER